MTIKKYTFFSPNGNNFPITANSDAKLYQMLGGMTDLSTFKAKHWVAPSNTALNRVYNNTSLFVGGRYFELESETVTLAPNATNYIHANINLSDTLEPVTISVETSENSNTVDINNDSGILKRCFEIVTTTASAVSTAVLSTQKRTFETVKVDGITSTTDTTLQPLTLTNVVTATLNYQRVNGIAYLTASGNWGNFTAGSSRTVGTLPTGFRPPISWWVGMNSQGGTPNMSCEITNTGLVRVTCSVNASGRYGGFSTSFPAN